MPDPLKTILQQIADLRIPVKEDESFYDGVDFEQLILEIQKAADLGQDLGKALMK